MTTTPIPAAAHYVALVGDTTPASLEYDTYRGWVTLADDWTYLGDTTATIVAALDNVQWVAPETTDYDRLGRIPR